MSKINILHLINTFEDSSINRIILRLIDNINVDNIHWHIGGLNGQGEIKDEFSRLNANVVDFSHNGLNNSGGIIKEIKDYVLFNDIKIVHTHTPRTIFLASLGLFKSSNTIHLATKHLLTSSYDRQWGVFFALIDRLSLYLPNQLIPVSQTMYQKIVRQPGLKRSRVNTIRNAIPYEQFYAPEQRALCRKELKISSDGIVLGYTGRIQKVKRIDLLIDAFNQVSILYPEAYLVIVGDGDARVELEAYATKLGISNKIVWTGFRKDVPQILAAIDIYVQTSSNEGLSLSILEAMAAGKPVIATDVGGNSEVIKNDVSGLLVPSGRIDEIVKAVSKLIDHPQLRKQFSLMGLELIQKDFSLDSMVGGYRKLYESVISEIKLDNTQ